MDRNAARNCCVAARGHGLRVVRGLSGGRKFSSILHTAEYAFSIWISLARRASGTIDSEQ
jgi:hypothetical protein